MNVNMWDQLFKKILPSKSVGHRVVEPASESRLDTKEGRLEDVEIINKEIIVKEMIP